VTDFFSAKKKTGRSSRTSPNAWRPATEKSPAPDPAPAEALTKRKSDTPAAKWISYSSGGSLKSCRLPSLPAMRRRQRLKKNARALKRSRRRVGFRSRVCRRTSPPMTASAARVTAAVAGLLSLESRRKHSLSTCSSAYTGHRKKRTLSPARHVLEDTSHQIRPKIDAGDASLLMGSIN